MSLLPAAPRKHLVSMTSPLPLRRYPFFSIYDHSWRVFNGFQEPPCLVVVFPLVLMGLRTTKQQSPPRLVALVQGRTCQAAVGRWDILRLPPAGGGTATGLESVAGGL